MVARCARSCPDARLFPRCLQGRRAPVDLSRGPLWRSGPAALVRARPLRVTGYAELAVTSNFSFLRGASHPEEFTLQAAALGLAGIGIADRNSVAGVVRAHSIAKVHGVRLAVGARLVFADSTPDI